MPAFAERVSGMSVHELRSKTAIGHVVLGPSRRVQPVRYRVMQTHPDEIRSWVRGTGNPKTPSLPWPALYRNVTELRIDPAAFESLYDDENRDDMPGVAFQFDQRTVLAAVMSTERAQDFFARMSSVYVRVGHDDANFTVGLINPWERTLTVPEGAVNVGIETTMRSADPTKSIY